MEVGCQELVDFDELGLGFCVWLWLRNGNPKFSCGWMQEGNLFSLQGLTTTKH